ncbi:MAG: hypothetical protein J6C85_06955 [Alphaproteobacteria bacterium]|nr:hypothetical protein [Alphaproteobacteria bacterium]
MKKLLVLTLMLMLSLPVLTLKAEDGAQSKHYELDEDKASRFKLKETEAEIATATETASQNQKMINENIPHIITEEFAGGRVEKLVDETGKVIAEKTIENDKIVKKVLNYYYPTGELSRKVIANEDDKGFYAEDYYTNSKLAAQATYINEQSKIGKEKKYDANGTLRQEIPWILPKEELNKPIEERQTVRRGNIITYYPDGRIAASFPVGQKGKTIFFNRYGRPLKEIADAKILNFTKELTEADCQSAAIKLELDELVELYEDEGDISYNKCGLPYRENFVYDVYEVKGQDETKFSYDETGMLRRITPYKEGQKNGLEQKFDAQGNVIAEINYKNGLKDGYANGYFPTRQNAFRKRYVNGKVEGKLTCYFPNGDVAAEFSYDNGIKNGPAVINSPIKRKLEFKAGKMLNAPEKSKRREMISNLSALEKPEEKCLDIDNKLAEMLLDISMNEQMLFTRFAIEYPEGCEDIASYKPEKSSLACYDKAQKLRAVSPVSYKRGDYAVQKIYAKDGSLRYEIPYKQKQRQGLAKEYDNQKRLIAEMVFDKNNLAQTSRTYYPNGNVKSVISFAEGMPRKLLARYDENGALAFSLTYKEDQKQEAYLDRTKDNQDVYIRFYNNAPESIRIASRTNPYDFSEYNLALGEYTVYKNNELVSGGKLCNYTIASDIDVITHQDLAKAAQSAVSQALKSEKAKEDVAPLKEPAQKTDDLEPLTEEEIAEFDKSMADYKLENAIIPTAEEKHRQELAAQNIGPVAKPDLNELSDVVQKEKLEAKSSADISQTPAKTEKFYYPNKNLRKTIKTRGTRTEEVKEYSKTGLLLTDIMYNQDNIITEKYNGSGGVRRKSKKSYDDNAVLAFLSREDYYDTGTLRYAIERQPETLLFIEKQYNPDGTVKSETMQNAPLSFTIKDYAKDGKLAKETKEEGFNTLTAEYNAEGKITKALLNGNSVPVALAKESQKVFKDNAKIYNNKGTLTAAFKTSKEADTLVNYYKNGQAKTKITFKNNGEISVKAYAKDGTPVKSATLAQDGKLYIKKPELRVIPSYRERYWVDYNNPRWIENQDKYSIKSIRELYLDTAAYILNELEIDIPEELRKLREQK